MVPAIAAGGRSFRGAALYYLHDKRQDGEAVRLTTDRVAWVETVNLPTGDPERAWRIMAHTALAQAELKAAAGIKATERKLSKPVFAYSIAWHPGERPTKAEQMEAARASLAAQGLEEHQAIILCHTDEPQAHVHIIVNRVHPATGKAVKTAAGAAAFITGQDYHKQARVTGRHTGLYPLAASRFMTSAWALRTLWRDEQPNPRNGQRIEPLSGLG